MSESAKRTAPTATPFINVTPLIDVLLVLLIIFMVISPARPHRFETRIPEKPDLPADVIVEPYSLLVTIKQEGGYAVNMQPAATLDELQATLYSALNGRPEDRKAVFIKAPRRTPYGEVIKVIDAMKAAGSAPIGMQLEDLN